MTEPFLVDLSALFYRHTRPRTVEIWRSMLRSGLGHAPIHVSRKEDGSWRVVSGAEVVEAAKLEGRVQIECVVK